MMLPDHFPSLSSALNKCPQFERRENPGPAAKRGSRVHGYIQKLLENKIELHTVPISYSSQCATALKIADRIGGERLLIEQTIEAKVGEFVVPCTPDYVVRTSDGIIAVNWKTGSQRDYRLAQRFYAAAICQRFLASNVKIIEAYIDSGHETSYTLNLENSIKLAYSLIETYLNRSELDPARCEWCRFCAKGPTGNASCETGCTYD